VNADEVYQCNKCGLCLSTCPVYRESLEEMSSPRAKVQLIKHYAEKDLASSSYLSEIIGSCLMCGTCTANCPSGVTHDQLFMRMRSEMVEDYGENWSFKVLFHLLSHEEQLRLAGKLSTYGANWLKNHVLGGVKLGTIPLKRFPDLNRIPFRKAFKETAEPRTSGRGTVLYFTGCATNYVDQEVGFAVTEVLSSMGYRVEIPGKQVCCGLPLFMHGRQDKARANIIRNIECLDREDVVAVLVDCATCGSALKREYPHLVREFGLDPDRALAVSAKTRDISEFLLENWEQLEPELEPEPGRVQRATYHAPCHLRNAQKLSTEVEEVLSRLPNVEYVRAPDFDQCCGGGGSFFYEHPEISKRIVSRKIDNAAATGATVWASGCPSCRINFLGNLEETQNMKVLHPVQLVQQALRASSSAA